jgi:ribose 5-phosphate isomerase A
MIQDPPKAAAFLSDVPGVVEHGLFIGIARTVIFGTETGARIIEY